MEYIPLRVHSAYSQGRGVVRPEELALAMQARGIPRLPVCDPLSLVAWDPFAALAHRRGLRPLLGVEIHLPEKGELLLFPLGPRGYLSLVSAFNRRRVGALAEVATVFLPAAPGAPGVPGGDDGRALQRLRRRLGADHFYIGLQWGSPAWIPAWARRCGAPLAWAQPLRWLKDPLPFRVARAVFEHLPLQESLRRADVPGGWILPAAISRRWGEAGREAMAGTWRLAEAVDFGFTRLEEASPDRDSSLANAVRKRLAERGHLPAERERALRELRLVEGMGFSPCFRIAAEISAYCRRNRILCNLRGSGVSSFLLYLLGASRINPLEHEGLIFERFVSSLREDLPDIDIDIDSSRRPELLSWVFAHWRERVAFVSTHKFFGARSALYETARCAGLDPEEAHGLTKSLPLFASPASLAGRERGKGMDELFAAASSLEGVFKELSLHVGGVVFCRQPAAAIFPLSSSPQGFPQMAWDKDAAERLKVFKLDLLGVRGFDVIAPLALEATPDSFRGDEDVWEMIGDARTLGCFQIESPLARTNLQRARPANLRELAIAVAIIRPGPAKAGMKAMYLERRPPAHPLLARLFPGTRGAIIFEEQVSLLLAHVAGWDLETAERVRRELKKAKKGQAGEASRREFYAFGAASGWRREELDLFWRLAADFSLYAFCQAHSVAYAHAAYLSAWMKRRLPLTFFCRLLNAGGGYYPLPVYVEEAKRWGVHILPPDVNRSRAGFSEEGQESLRTGLRFVKGVGEKLCGRILERRGAGGAGYISLEDFVLRTRAGEHELAALLSVSAFASLGMDGFSPAEREANWKRSLGFLPSSPGSSPPPAFGSGIERDGKPQPSKS